MGKCKKVLLKNKYNFINNNDDNISNKENNDKELSNTNKHKQSLLRHRREKINGVFTKGQKKRLIKKARIFKKIQFENNVNKAKQSKLKNTNKTTACFNSKINKEFTFDNINEELININENTDSNNKRLSKKAKNKLANLILYEKNKITSVLNNPEFQKNPSLAMRNHLFNIQFEKNKQIQSNLLYKK